MKTDEEKARYQEFHNMLRVLLNIDHDEFVQWGGASNEWPTFARNPWDWFIRAGDGVMSTFWPYVEARAGRKHTHMAWDHSDATYISTDEEDACGRCGHAFWHPCHIRKEPTQ